MSLGSNDYGLTNSVTFDSSSVIQFGASGFTGGKLSFINAVIHSPSTQLLASTQIPASVGTVIFIRSTQFDGSLHVKTDDISLINSTFNGSTILNKDGYSWDGNGNGGNVFNKPVELINSGGYDWKFGILYPDIYKDSVRISLSGTGQHQIAGSNRGALFKVGMVNGNRFEGPVRIESGTTHSGDVMVGNFGSAEFLSSVELANFKSGNLIFYNSKFRGADLGRTMMSAGSGVGLFFKANCLFEGPLSIKAPHFGSDYTTFMKPVVIEKTSEDNDISLGGNLFHQRVQFKNTSGTGIISLLSGEDKLIERVPQ